MFYYLKGNITHKGTNFAVIDIGGAGYKVYTSTEALSRAVLGGCATMYTYVHIREDIMDIYGFPSEEELSFFERLISVSGVGPKAALSILSVLSPRDIVISVVTNDAKAITKAPGVGIKIAQRIVLELKDKMRDADVGAAGAAEEVDGEGEAVGALMALGYSGQEARRAVMSVGDKALSTEDIIKEALKRLMR